ncbi:MAG: flagellar export chaperone FliS [Verrucomicrobiia bacterium]|jgi:flagellar protein FliS
MNRVNPLRSYQQISTQTATPGQLVLMLFDGAIRFLERARVGFQYDDPLLFNQTINDNILRAQEIINELNASLNMEAGGEFAANMRRLYEYMDWRLMTSNFKKEESGIVEIIGYLTTLRDAWAEMLRNQGQSDSLEISRHTSAVV